MAVPLEYLLRCHQFIRQLYSRIGHEEEEFLLQQQHGNDSVLNDANELWTYNRREINCLHNVC